LSGKSASNPWLPLGTAARLLGFDSADIVALRMLGEKIRAACMLVRANRRRLERRSNGRG